MTIDTPASVIAQRYTASGKFEAELELAILRHMEHHVAKAVEACAAIADKHMQMYRDKASGMGDTMMKELAMIRAETASLIAIAIRASDKPFTPKF